MSASDLKAFPLLAEFNDEDREALFELLEPRSVAQGRRIFSEGAEADGLVLLVSGTARLESKRGIEPELLPSGNALGAVSLVSMGPREVTAYAEEACQMLLFPRTSWRRLVDDHPRTACRLAEAMLLDLAGLVRLGLDRLSL